MTVVEDRVFENEIVIMDDKHFHRCVFNACTLWYNGGDFGWTDSKFEGPQVIRFGGAALRTITYLKNWGKLHPDYSKELEQNRGL